MTIEHIEPNKDIPLSGEEEHERAALVDLLVPAAMLAVAVSAGVGSYLHLGLRPEFAAAIALTLFCLMLVGHILMRVSDPPKDAVDERRMVSSPMPSISAQTKQRRKAAGPPAADSDARMLASNDGQHDTSKTLAAELAQPESTAITDELAASIGAARDVEIAAMRSFIEQGVGGGPSAVAGAPTEAVGAHPETSPQSASAPAWGSPRRNEAVSVVESDVPTSMPRLSVHPGTERAQDNAELARRTDIAWGYRPIDQRLPVTSHPVDADRNHSLGAVKPAALEPAANLSARTEAAIAEARRIDNILHRLATQIRAGQAANAVAEPASTERPEGVCVVQADVVADVVDVPTEKGAQADNHAEQESALTDAVDALRATVETMRHMNSGDAVVSVPAGQPISSVGNAAMLRLAAVAEALASERAQVLLEPILKLSDEEARHFEVSVHLINSSGDLLDARAMSEGARGAGLLPLLDALGIRHSAGFALKLERRGRDGAVFSEVAGESLESEGFVTDVAGRHAQGIADRLVLSFAQSEVRGLGPAQFGALARLRQLGFRFAMQNVADLDMDFEALAAVGFEFVKLDAAIFLNGLELAGAHIPASDLTSHFVELGLDVIVGRIDAELTRARVLACGAEFGQGPLFGAPRVIPTGHPIAGGVAA